MLFLMFMSLSAISHWRLAGTAGAWSRSGQTWLKIATIFGRENTPMMTGGRIPCALQDSQHGRTGQEFKGLPDPAAWTKAGRASHSATSFREGFVLKMDMVATDLLVIFVVCVVIHVVFPGCCASFILLGYEVPKFLQGIKKFPFLFLRRTRLSSGAPG